MAYMCKRGNLPLLKCYTLLLHLRLRQMSTSNLPLLKGYTLLLHLRHRQTFISNPMLWQNGVSNRVYDLSNLKINWFFSTGSLCSLELLQNCWGIGWARSPCWTDFGWRRRLLFRLSNLSFLCRRDQATWPALLNQFRPWTFWQFGRTRFPWRSYFLWRRLLFRLFNLNFQWWGNQANWHAHFIQFRLSAWTF